MGRSPKYRADSAQIRDMQFSRAGARPWPPLEQAYLAAWGVRRPPKLVMLRPVAATPDIDFEGHRSVRRLCMWA